MTTQSKFYYLVTMHQDAEHNTYLAPVVSALPLVQNLEDMVVILGLDVGVTAQGLYMFDGIQWRFTMPMPAISGAIIRGDNIDLYYNRTDDVTLDPSVTVYKNGQQQSTDIITHGNAVYAVRTPPPGQIPAVTSVNGQTGAVTVNAANLPGLAIVAQTGAYSDLVGLPPAYSLPVATPTVLGGVIVPTASSLSVDGSGNIDIKASVLTAIAAAIQSVVTSGTGTSLIKSVASGTATLKSVIAGTGMTITDDGNGTLTFVSSGSALVPATPTALGGVIVPSASHIAVDGSGNIDLSSAFLAAFGTKIGTVADAVPASGTSLIASVTAGSALFNTLSAGSGISIALAGGTITISSGAVPATTTSLGLVQIGTGLNVDVSGLLSLAKATASTLGGVVVGAGLTVDGAGTISYNLPIASASVLGGIKIGTGLSIDVNGVVEAAASMPATTTTIGAIIVGSGLAVQTDGTLSAVFPVTSINTKLGDVVITAGTGMTIDNSGSGIILNVTLSQAQVIAALGYTPYNGTLNPSGFLTANQTITVTGDVSGSGTTALNLVFANSGVAAGTYTKVTVDTKGRVTAGLNPTTLNGYGITDALNAITGGAVTGTVTFGSGAKLTGLIAPQSGSDAATKDYVDTAIQGVANGTSWKANANAASTGPLTLSGLQTVDGYVLQTNDRVLVKDQTDQTINGVYVASAGAWTRATDLDSGAELQGMAILVLNGSANALTQWVNTAASPITVGTTNLVYAKLQPPPPAYTAGTGLSITANQFSIANTGVTAGVYTKVTVNAQGQVTAGAQFSITDISTALGYTPYNASNPANYISTNLPITLSGDATGTGTTAINVTLATSGVTPGTYSKVTVDAKGRVTVGANLSNTEIVAAIGYTPVNRAGDTMSGALNDAPAVTVASAATMLIGAAASNTCNISGTTNITAFDSIPNGAVRNLIFAGVLTLTNSSNLTLPTGANITTAAGDTAVFVSQGSGIWKCLNYSRASGAALVGAPDVTKLPLAGGTLSGTLNLAPQVAVTAAATTTIAAQGANDIIVNGATTITAFDAAPLGAVRTLTFYGGALLTNNIVSLVLPTSANIQTIPGDSAQFTSISGGWRCDWYTRHDGTPLAGSADPTKLPLAGGKMTGALNLATSVTIASSAVPAIGAAASNEIIISGTTTITGFDSIADGAVRRVTFTGILTLTNSSTLILPGATNIATAVGDGAQFTSLGAGSWRCDYYTRANGTAVVGAFDATKLPLAGGTMSGALNFAPTVTVASASTVNIGAAAANDIAITGTTSIVAFDTVASGIERQVTFAGILTLTNSTGLILPGTTNITTAAGDTAHFTSKGGGIWRCDSYQKANGQAVVSGGSPYATTQEFDGSGSAIAARFKNAIEIASIIAAAPAATQNFYVANGAVQFHTVSATANWIWNFASDASNTLNSVMAVGDSLTVCGLTTQGTTAFYPNTLRIDGSTVTAKWLGGAPTSGNASGVDIYTFTIIKTAAATFSVFGSVSQFK